MCWIIYCHINKTNNKRYIGLTKNKLSKRTGRGSGYAQTQLAFYNAIQKYGWDNFEHIILEDKIETLALAREREKYWISYYHTWIYDSECWGYNMTPGGDISGSSNYTTVMKDTEHKYILITELDKYLADGWHITKHNEKWDLEHIEERKAYTKQYRQEHLEQHYLNNKRYNEAHKEEIKEYMKKYREEHKEKQKAYMKEYYKTHPDTRDRRAYSKEYYQKHKKIK